MNKNQKKIYNEYNEFIKNESEEQFNEGENYKLSKTNFNKISAFIKWVKKTNIEIDYSTIGNICELVKGNEEYLDILIKIDTRRIDLIFYIDSELEKSIEKIRGYIEKYNLGHIFTQMNLSDKKNIYYDLSYYLKTLDKYNIKYNQIEKKMFNQIEENLNNLPITAVIDIILSNEESGHVLKNLNLNEQNQLALLNNNYEEEECNMGLFDEYIHWVYDNIRNKNLTFVALYLIKDNSKLYKYINNKAVVRKLVDIDPRALDFKDVKAYFSEEEITLINYKQIKMYPDYIFTKLSGKNNNFNEEDIKLILIAVNESPLLVKVIGEKYNLYKEWLLKHAKNAFERQVNDIYIEKTVKDPRYPKNKTKAAIERYEEDINSIKKEAEEAMFRIQELSSGWDLYTDLTSNQRTMKPLENQNK